MTTTQGLRGDFMMALGSEIEYGVVLSFEIGMGYILEGKAKLRRTITTSEQRHLQAA